MTNTVTKINPDAEDVSPLDLFHELATVNQTEQQIQAVYEINVAEVLEEACKLAGDKSPATLMDQFAEMVESSWYVSCPEEQVARIAAVNRFNEEYGTEISNSYDAVRSRPQDKPSLEKNALWEVEITV